MISCGDFILTGCVGFFCNLLLHFLKIRCFVHTRMALPCFLFLLHDLILWVLYCHGFDFRFHFRFGVNRFVF